MQYPKINTIWKRDMKTGKIIEGDFSCPEFGNVKYWNVTEKIDGTNIRIFYEPDSEVAVRFGGRTDNASIPTFLLEQLQKTFTKEKLGRVFSDVTKVILFGEGYGPKIQKGGGLYRKDVSFILFDIWISCWWLERDKVNEISKQLNIDVVPEIGMMTYEEIVEFIKRTPKSLCAKEEKIIEGIVARSYPLMLFRNGKPVMWKLKVRDYDL